MTLRIRARIERWPTAGSFVISRGARTEVVVVLVEIDDGTHRGQAECVPYARYGETAEGVVAAIESAGMLEGDRERLRESMPAGAARNGLDCALWDYEAKRDGVPAWARAGFAGLKPLETAFTISLGEPDAMAAATRAAFGYPILKLKLGGAGDPARLRAVRAAAPEARLIADANEAWSEGNFAENMAACAAAGVALVEQPLPADADDLLGRGQRAVPVCADESLHVTADLDALRGKYDAVNIKLDKAGGLTEALLLAGEARRAGFSVMVGCMVGTSLAMAPATLLAQTADWVDLDGPLLLARDREPGLRYEGALLHPPPTELWG
jgi:L-alanine-DL-glutamate epimerase-like enolase superfamily enzyme